MDTLEEWVELYVGGKDNPDYDYLIALPYLWSLWKFKENQIEELNNQEMYDEGK